MDSTAPWVYIYTCSPSDNRYSMKSKFSNIMIASLLAIASLSLTGCDDSSPFGSGTWYHPISITLQKHRLECNKEKLSFDGSVSSDAMSVKCVNTPWRFTGMADWLRLSPQSGDKDASVSVSVTENPSVHDIRTCVLNLKSEASDFPYSPNVTVTQAKATPYINVLGKSFDFIAAGETKTVSVLSNIVYDVNSSQTWLQATVSADRKTLTLKCAPNTTTSTRTAYVSLSGMGVNTTTISVSQAGAGINLSQTTPISAPAYGGKYNLQLESDVAWTATCGSYSWINVSPSQGNAGTSAVLLEVAPNATTSSRTGYVYFKIGTTNVVELKVQQEGIYMNLSSSSVNFDADACTRDVSVNSNYEWKVLSKPEWVNAPTESVLGDGTLTLGVEDNNSTSSRSGVVTIGIEGLSTNKDIEVVQQGRTFGNLIGTLQFAAEGGSQFFTITADYYWTAISNQSWLTLSSTSGNGTTVVTATVPENNLDHARMAKINVRVGDTEKSISVTQRSHYLTITPTDFEALPSTGGTYELTIASDDAWTASTKAPWLSVSPNSGTGNIDVKVTAADNPSVNERKDSLFISTAFVDSIKVVILQSARYLTVDTRDIYFFYRGGESEPVLINTDGTYTVTTQDSWLTIKETGKTFTVTATENTGEDARTGKVVVALAGLQTGESKEIEIPVVQGMKNQVLDKGDFSADEDWSVVGGDTHITISILRFANDEDWNNEVGGNSNK